MGKRLRIILKQLLGTHAAWPVLLAVGLLCGASSLAVAAAGGAVMSGAEHRNIAAGLAALLLLLIPHYEWFGRLAYLALGAVVLLLAGVLLTEPINGSRRWFLVTSTLQVQPSELAKLAFICALAWYLRYRKTIRELRGLLIPFALMLVPCGLILKEPDLGTALLFPMVLYAMLIAAGARLRHLLLIVVVAGAVLPGFYPLLRPYQQDRVRSILAQWLHREDSAFIQAHRRGPGYQQYMSMVAVASGGATGHGVGGADLVRRGILPEAHTDFIFAVVGSQWGFMGTATAVLLYLAFLAAGLEIAASTKDPFGRLVVVGIVSMILSQAWINIAMTVGLGPVVGIALPFISYGGSSLLTNMVAAGILLNVSVRRKTKTTRLSPEYAAA